MRGPTLLSHEKTTQSSCFVHTHILTLDKNPFNLSNLEFFLIVRLKGFPHVFAKLDENNKKIIKEGAKNALKFKKQIVQ
jgi:hypothetical protein